MRTLLDEVVADVTEEEPVNSAEVAVRWRDGRPAHNSGAFRTDGSNLYSYDIVIGRTEGNGKKILYNYSSREIRGTTGVYLSHATSRHVALALGVASGIRAP